MKKSKSQAKIVWGVFMTAIYIGIAYLLYFTPLLISYNQFNDQSNDRYYTLRTILAIIFFIYGIARGARTYRQWKVSQNQNT